MTDRQCFRCLVGSMVFLYALHDGEQLIAIYACDQCGHTIHVARHQPDGQPDRRLPSEGEWEQ